MTTNLNRYSVKNARLVLALLAAGAIGGAGVGLTGINSVHAESSPTVTTLSAPVALPDFSQITRQYGPAVVNISVTGQRDQAGTPPFCGGPPCGPPGDPGAP